MIKRITTVFLIFVVTAANFSQLCIYAGFSLNQKYIASSLCENRDKPWLHCNGKCYFMKKIKQAQEKEKNEERQSQKNLFQDAFFTQITAVKFYSQMLLTMQVPNHCPALPVIVLPIYQPPRLG